MSLEARHTVRNNVSDTFLLSQWRIDQSATIENENKQQTGVIGQYLIKKCRLRQEYRLRYYVQYTSLFSSCASQWCASRIGDSTDSAVWTVTLIQDSYRKFHQKFYPECELFELERQNFDTDVHTDCYTFRLLYWK